MLTKEGFIVIQALIRQGVYLCDIARQLGVHPKTVRRALLRGRAPDGRRGRRRSQLDPYRADIDRLLTAGVWNAVVIFRELQAKGYAGQLSILRDYIRPKRTLRPSRATVRFETEPGHQMQSDWAVIQSEIAGRPTTVAFIVNTLGFSRRIHFWCSHSTDAEHTYEGLIRAFEWFGGVPHEVLVDNQKAAVLEHPRGGLVQFQPRFLVLAGHYGFVPKACRPARAQTKGKDERMVGYIKHHFFVRLRRFESWAHLNQVDTGCGRKRTNAATAPPSDCRRVCDRAPPAAAPALRHVLGTPASQLGCLLRCAGIAAVSPPLSLVAASRSGCARRC